MSVLITGASGFIGRATCKALIESGFNVRGTVRRRNNADQLDRIDIVETGEISPKTDWQPLLEGINAVVHLAARVHQMQEEKENSQAAYQETNVEVTMALAEAAIKAKVKRFVFISSIKAMGEETEVGKPWNESSPCLPQDAYGRSKYDAECTLIDIAQKTGLEVVILRLPLVYGPNLKANMARLFYIVVRGFPLPLALVKNERSLLFIGNLLDAIRVTLDHPKAEGQTFLVSDAEDVSTPELIRRIASALNRPARLFPFPPALLQLIGKLTGKSSTVDRLLNSLAIDSSKIHRELDWTPPYSMEQGLQQTADWFEKVKSL